MRSVSRFSQRLAFGALVLITLLGAAAPGQAQSYGAPGYGSYVVQYGDTLFGIAARFNVGLSDLATINHIYDINTIYAGEYLILPAPLPPGYYSKNPVYQPPVGNVPPAPYIAYRTYTVCAGDYLNAIALRFHVSVAAIIAANAATLADPNILYVGSVLLIPYTVTPKLPPPRSFHGNFYVVQPGDTLFAIAARFGQDVYAIARANGILNLNAIYAGTVLLIP